MDVGFMGGNYGLLVKLVLLTSAIYIVDSIINVMKEKKEWIFPLKYSIFSQSNPSNI